MISDRHGKKLLGEMERGAETGVAWREVLNFNNVSVSDFAMWVDRSDDRRHAFSQIRKTEQS